MMKVIVLLFSFVVSVTALGADKPTYSLGRPHVPREVLVKYKPTAGIWAQGNLRAAYGLRSQEKLKRLESFKIPERASLAKTIEALKKDPSVEWAQPNYIYRASLAPNDTNYATQQWSLNNSPQTVSGATYLTNNPGTAGADMNVEAAWNRVTDCSAVTVAVLDSGIRHEHLDLVDNMWDGTAAGFPNHGYDFVDEDNNPTDLNGHGTHVAGTIGAVGNNGMGISGVCWDVKLMAVRVLDAAGSGSTTDIIEGLEFAAEEGAQIINLSLGGEGEDRLLEAAMVAASNAGVFIAGAAGNSGDNLETVSTIPCNTAAENFVCVAALDQKLELASFSNYGSTQLDVGAPGTNILSPFAGTVTRLNDNLNAGASWTFPVANPGWGYEVINIVSNGSPLALNIIGAPDNYDGVSNRYANNLDGRVYKNFDMTGQDVVTASFGLFIDMLAGDFFRIYYDNADVDPVTAGNAGKLYECDNCTTDGSAIIESFQLDDCANAADCNVGMQITTNATGQFVGVALGGFLLESLALANTSYAIENGTSMASPHVAGLAALLKAYHPSYTAADITDAIKYSGDANTALSGKSSTGKSINADSALLYVRTPQSVTISGE